MGRKIPARKHHGVRDPIKQNEQRLAAIKDKINNPPEKQDFQKVSHKLADFIKLKDDVKSGTFTFKKPKVNEDKPENYKTKKHSIRNNKQLPSIRRYQNESDEDYLRRVNRVTRESIQESQFEAKYGVEVIRNPKTGEIKLKKRPKDELEEQMKKARKENADVDGKKKRKVADVKLTPSEQKVLVKKMIAERKEKEKAKVGVEEYKKDEIKFGEIVHAPPHLVTPRKGTKADTVPRPGRKNLILHSVISGTVDDSKPQIKTKQKLPSFDLKGKRKELPTGTRQMIENQQKAAVEMYRELKKKNRADESR